MFFLLLSIYIFSIETHNFHLNYSNNFPTYLPASFMTSCNPQLPSSCKNLLPKLKICYYTFLHKTFQRLWNISKNVHFEMLACFNYSITNIKSTNSYELSTMKRSSSKYCWVNQTLKKLLLYLSLNSGENSTIFWVIIVNFKIQSFNSLNTLNERIRIFQMYIQYQCHYAAKSY